MRWAAKVDAASSAAWQHQGLLQYGIYKQFLSSPESCRQTVQKRVSIMASLLALSHMSI
jgi:hypothetical protein